MEYFVSDGKPVFPYHMHLINSKWPKTMISTIWLENSSQNNWDPYSCIYPIPNFQTIENTNIGILFKDISSNNKLEEITIEKEPELYKEMQDDVLNFIRSLPVITLLNNQFKIYEAEVCPYFYTKICTIILEMANLDRKIYNKKEYLESLLLQACENVNYIPDILKRKVQSSFNNNYTNFHIGECLKIELQLQFPSTDKNIYIIKSKSTFPKIVYKPRTDLSNNRLSAYMNELIGSICYIHQKPINIFMHEETNIKIVSNTDTFVYNRANNFKYLKNIVI